MPTVFSATVKGGVIVADDIDGVPHRERLESLTKGYRRLARVLAPGWAVRRAVRQERADSDRINRVFDDHDVLLTPMTAGPAVEVGRWHDRRAMASLLGQSRWYPYAIPWNHTGQPAASVPARLSADGLPIAVQLVSPPNDEATLLSLVQVGVLPDREAQVLLAAYRFLRRTESRRRDVLRLHRARRVDDEDDGCTLGDDLALHLRPGQPHEERGDPEHTGDAETGYDEDFQDQQHDAGAEQQQLLPTGQRDQPVTPEKER